MIVLILIGYILALVAVFYLLTQICRCYFVESLEHIAKKLKLSQDVAGATLMAFGGSAPEFLIVVITLIHPGNHANFGAGTIVGSAVFNILVVVGISAMISTTYLAWKPVIRDIIFYVIAILTLFLVFQDGRVTWQEGLTLLVLYGVYLITLFSWQKLAPKKDQQSLGGSCAPKSRTRRALKFLDYLFYESKQRHTQFYVRIFITSIVTIGLLSWALVEIVIRVSNILEIPETFIALTLVAFGTSVPDLITSIIMARQGRGAMAIADALGSNIFDILFGFGLPWLVYTLITQDALLVSTENLQGSIILLFATVIVTIVLLVLRKFKIGRSAGAFLIFCYLIYLAYTILYALEIV